MVSLTRGTPLRRRAAKPKRRGTVCEFNRCKRRPRAIGLCATHLERRAEKAVGDFVRARDGVCVSCGSPGPLDWAHIVSRGARYVKFDPSNSCALCRPCHYRYTRSPASWAVFVETHWPGRMSEMAQREAGGQRRGGHVDLAGVIAAFGGAA